MRISEGAFKVEQLASGGTASYHEMIPGCSLFSQAKAKRLEDSKKAARRPVTVEPGTTLADVATRHAVYDALLSLLRLEEPHRLDLLRRKAPLPFSGSYASFPTEKPWNIVAKLREKFSDEQLLSVPGFVIRQNKEGEPYLSFKGAPGMLIAVRNARHQIVGLKLRLYGDDAKDGKYRWITSRTKDNPLGPSPGTPGHCPLSVKGPCSTLRLTEGPLKADAASALDPSTPTIAADSTSNWVGGLELALELGAQTIRVAFDSDSATNNHVAHSLLKLADAAETGILAKNERRK